MFILNHVTICIAFFRQGWDPIRADITLLVDRDIFLFLQFSQSGNLGAFTGNHPSLRGIAHRSSVVRSTFRCLINWTLRQGMASLYADFNHT